MKRIVCLLLIILGLMVAVGGCVRWTNGPNGNGGTENYQLEITVEVAGEINAYDGVYYIVLDADGNPANGPGDDVKIWDNDFYYVKLDGMGFYFALVEEGSASISLTDSSYNEKKLQVSIALSDLVENPSSLDINVLTTDSNNVTYDSLDDGYFTISTGFGSSKDISDSEGDSEDGEDFDIVKVTAKITTP